ncbi:MAG TPA: hypothetical protein VFR87_01685 [Nocardioidaceae bacterium]|nr:hypothetical protein [Nocardioidaceae bacterium]
MQTTKNPFRRLRTHKARPASEHLVSDGRVGCPRSAVGEVDLDRCLSCPLLSEIKVDDDGRTWLSCKPASRLLTAAELRAI